MHTAFQGRDFAFKIEANFFSLTFKDSCDGLTFYFFWLIQTQLAPKFPSSCIFGGVGVGGGPCYVVILGLGSEEHHFWTSTQDPRYQEHFAPLKPEFWMQRQPLHRGVCQIVDIKRQIKSGLLQKAKGKAYFPVDLWASRQSRAC